MDIEQILKEKNLKITKHRKELLNIINETEEATIKKIQKSIKIDKSTMYRILELFLEKELIEKNINYKNEIYYEIKKHNHYIKCIKCHKKQKIDICPIENIKTKDYEIISHKIEIDGICKDCKNS